MLESEIYGRIVEGFITEVIYSKLEEKRGRKKAENGLDKQTAVGKMYVWIRNKISKIELTY